MSKRRFQSRIQISLSTSPCRKFLRLKFINKFKPGFHLWKTPVFDVENYGENRFITIARSWKDLMSINTLWIYACFFHKLSTGFRSFQSLTHRDLAIFSTFSTAPTTTV
jgi:hypothetical protein